MKKQWLVLLVLIALVGMGNQSCEQPETDVLPVTPRLSAESTREYTVTSKGFFEAGYRNIRREIFILKNNVTGKEYLGVTDCHLIEILHDEDEDASELMDFAIDAALSVE